MAYLDRIFASLESFENIKNVENDHALFLTNTPDVAPLAYLNVIFKPEARDVRREVARELAIPAPLAELYSETNGFRLLQTVFVYGLFPKTGYLLNRRDPYQAPPWNIRQGRRVASPPGTSWLAFGGYRGSIASLFIERGSGLVCAAKNDDLAVIAEWPTLEEWLQSELDRLVPLFETDGRTSTNQGDRLPSSESTTILREPGRNAFIAPPPDLRLDGAYWERVRGESFEATPITLCRDGRDVAISNAYYAYDHEGRATPGWSADWAVIATEDLGGDPIFIDRKGSDRDVFTTPRAPDKRAPTRIATSPEAFVESVVLTENCIRNEGDQEELIQAIASINGGAAVDLSFWRAQVEPREGS